MENQKTKEQEQTRENPPAIFSPRFVGMLADEVARIMIHRLPHLLPSQSKKKTKKSKRLDQLIILDTSAIIDRRIFDVIRLGLLTGSIVIPEEVLLELKHIADSQDTVRRERGRKGLEELDNLKKQRVLKVSVMPVGTEEGRREVDELLIAFAKRNKGRIITCDYNLEKKAAIQNVRAVNVNALANALKVTAVPGEALHIRLLHQGKEANQGVGYLDDGTMIVVEQGSDSIGKTIDVVISRVIQTATGRILFAKKI